MSKALIEGDIYLVLIILLVGFGSFGLGRLSIGEERKEPVRIEYPSYNEGSVETSDTFPPATEVLGILNVSGKYVGSIHGNKYHLPWCGSARRIKEENEIWFDSKEEAGEAGYGPAANCPGL